MSAYSLTPETEAEGFKKMIPEVYPPTVEECMVLLARLKYKSYGFPMVMHYYNCMTRSWDVTFRNPAYFSNPDIKGTSPIDACHKMFDFLKTLPHGDNK